MARKRRNAPQGVERRDQWLRGGQLGRTRPWAYEELLFGPGRARDRERELDRTYALVRCEGFQVDSPSGYLGVIEGIRFVSRIDRPDLLEVRAGRFGRTLLLIPVEEVEEISRDEERVVVRSAPPLHGAHLGELVLRVRKALTVGHSES